jgi:hypothetical protein
VMETEYQISNTLTEINQTGAVTGPGPGPGEGGDSSTTAKKKRPRGSWSPSEDEALRQAVQKYGAKQWRTIAESVPNRSHVQCLHRWQKVLDPGLVKGPWTKEEDDKVVNLVRIHGVKKWSIIASQLPGRIGKQCRERWTNHLDPSLKKGNWEPQEDELIISVQKEVGNKWAYIARLLPGRSDNAVKNRFYSTLSRKDDKRKSRNGSKKSKRGSVEKVENVSSASVKPVPLVEYRRVKNEKPKEMDPYFQDTKKIQYHVDVVKEEEDYYHLLFDNNFFLNEWSVNYPSLESSTWGTDYQFEPEVTHFEPTIIELDTLKFSSKKPIDSHSFNEIMWNEGY